MIVYETQSITKGIRYLLRVPSHISGARLSRALRRQCINRSLRAASVAARQAGSPGLRGQQQGSHDGPAAVRRGITHDRIAVAIGVSEPRLRWHFARHIKVEQTEIDAQAVGTLVAAMRGGGKEAAAAAKFWCQSRMGWSERVIIDDGKLADARLTAMRAESHTIWAECAFLSHGIMDRRRR